MLTNKYLSLRSTATLFATGLSAAVFCGGCAGPGARTIETGSSESVTSIDHIDDQDWSKAAQKLTSSMMSTDNLFTANADGKPKRLAISRIKDSTAQNVNTNLLVNQIRAILFKSGKVVVTTTGGLTVEDPLAKKNQDKLDYQNDNTNLTARMPDYTLSGELIETRASAGDIRQATFYFKMTLTNTDGDAVWEDQTPITKIGAHNSVGL